MSAPEVLVRPRCYRNWAAFVPGAAVIARMFGARVLDAAVFFLAAASAAVFVVGMVASWFVDDETDCRLMPWVALVGLESLVALGVLAMRAVETMD